MKYQLHHGEKYEGLDEFDSGFTYSGLRFVDCNFCDCTLALSVNDLSRRAHIIDVELRNCLETACSMTAAIVENVLVDGLKTSGIFQTWAAVFKHVTLKGKIDRVMLSDLFHPGYSDSKFQQIIAKANADYYAKVDWALDISEAEFIDFDCRGVPSRLVRRDPETQIMVIRDRVLAAGDAIKAGGEWWEGMLKLFLKQDKYNNYSDTVFIAPKRDPNFKELAAGLRELRSVGIAEPD